MRTNRTFTMIKPDAVKNGYTGEILDKIIKAGYKVIALKYTKLTKQEAEGFYAVHSDKPFFEELTNFMSSGPIYAAILEKEDAIKSFRAFIGATNPVDAAEGSIRKLYATSLGENAIHGSDSDENALIEGSYFFSKLEEVE
ncbi:nucleoside diphosphate kinase [Balneicella halophila]|uniref:Nucleoside diphosphate kinase n=1 Tax=Balneicella halophila TaxID=1537566 RepID=A0A7L4UNI7_BALHA|nr:nucleoside-diphosphate kinase [Balneicella halophila]PVX49898.1 nucleoside diphosphate kinase [Balneicella halophila]